MEIPDRTTSCRGPDGPGELVFRSDPTDGWTLGEQGRDSVTQDDEVCRLCSLPVGDAAVTAADGAVFCCRGCRAVDEVLADQEEADGRTGASLEAVRTERGRSDPPDHHRSTFLRIDGMHCATCEAYIELVAANHAGVSSVRASYVSDTVRVDHDPDVVDEAALVELVSGLGYRAYPRDDSAARKRADERTTLRIGAGLLFGAFVMFGYMMLIYPTYFGDLVYGPRGTELLLEGLYQGAASYLFVVLGVLTSVVLFYTGWPILRGAYVSLRASAPNMDLLIALAAMSAYAYSWLEIYVGGTHIYFDVTVAIILVVTVGGEYENRIKRRALDRLSDLTRTRVDVASVYDGQGGVNQVAIDELEPGDKVLVREGERIPVDGVVLEGECAVDEAVITGESLPVRKRPGDGVIGGSLLHGGSAVVTVDEDAGSSLDRINQLVWNLQSSNHGIQKLADRLATIFVPLVLVLAIAVTMYYLAAGGADLPSALLVGLTVLIVSCPCAMGLATPLAVASGVRDALSRGIVVFDDTVFERLRDVDVVVFDKTGTLTTGRMSVLEANGPADLLALAGALERRSSHPIATAIADEFAPGPDSGAGRSTPGGNRQADGGVVDPDHHPGDPSAGVTSTPSVTAFESHASGVSGVVDDTDLLVGHPTLFEERDWTVPDWITSQLATHRRQGRVPVVMGRNGRAEGLVIVGDRPRDGWEVTLADLADRGISVVVLTGDDEAATTPFGDHPAVEHVFAGVPPEAKAEVVQRFAAENQTVMVGDGTNDAPALASADLGIALGSGTAIAADAADMAIVDDDLATVEEAFDLSAAAGRRVKQNIGWAFLYNGIAIPIAIAGLLNPLFAALAMATSSLLVVTNSTRELS